MKKVFIVVDMQVDFVTGSLGTGEAQAIVPRLCEKLQKEKEQGTRIIFTKDTHGEEYLDTQEGGKLPVKHCIHNTDGWQIHETLQPFCSGQPVDKVTFGSVELGKQMAAWNQEDPITSIELIGLCTDICVISNALLLKVFLPETPIAMDAACCAGDTPESHANALRAMQMCQIGLY